MKKILIMAALAASCGQDEGFKTIGSDLDAAVHTIENNGKHVEGKINEAGQHVGSSMEDFSDLGIEKREAANRKGDMAKSWVIEKHEAAKEKGQENGEATEDKFHETKDSMTKRATGFDRDAQSDTDATQDAKDADQDSYLTAVLDYLLERLGDLDSSVSDLEDEDEVVSLVIAILTEDLESLTGDVEGLEEWAAEAEEIISELEEDVEGACTVGYENVHNHGPRTYGNIVMTCGDYEKTLRRHARLRL